VIAGTYLRAPVLATDSKAQVTALQLIIGSLQRCSVFGEENRASLVHKATGYSAKLLKKPDQCRAVYTCAHLFWHDSDEALCDAESVLACLKRALKIANAAQARAALALVCLAGRPADADACCLLLQQQQMATASRGDAGPVVLFVEILNKCALACAGAALTGVSYAAWRCRYLYFFDKGCEAVTPEVIQGLLQLIANELTGEAARTTEVDAFHKATLEHIRTQQGKDGDLAARYAAISV
jgi:vacuolar protein sorting-associated protein 35